MEFFATGPPGQPLSRIEENKRFASASSPVEKKVSIVSDDGSTILNCSRIQPIMITPGLERGRSLTSSPVEKKLKSIVKSKSSGSEVSRPDDGPIIFEPLIFTNDERQNASTNVDTNSLIGNDEVALHPFSLLPDADNERDSLVSPERKKPKIGSLAYQVPKIKLVTPSDASLNSVTAEKTRNVKVGNMKPQDLFNISGAIPSEEKDVVNMSIDPPSNPFARPQVFESPINTRNKTSVFPVVTETATLCTSTERPKIPEEPKHFFYHYSYYNY